MPAIISPKIGLTYGYNDGEDGWGAAMNQNLLTVDSMIQGWVISRALAAPPGAPNPGDMYIVAAAATGDWTGHTGDVAAWTLYGGGHWLFLTPHYNWRLWVDAEGLFCRYNGAAWVAETVGAVGGGIVGFSTVASMTLAFVAGTVGAVFNDPDPSNNFPRVAWLKSGASGSGAWTKGFDNLAAIITDITMIKNVLRRAVVINGEGIIDRINVLGGGTGQVYVPRNVLVDVPGVVSAPFTVANADSTEKPGWAKLTIPAALRSLLYLDLVDNTYKFISAPAGDLVLPTLDPDKTVEIITFPPGTAGFRTTFKFRELNPASNITAFWPVSPIVHSRRDNKVYIPSATVRTPSAVISHTVAAGDLYEAFDLSASGVGGRTYWFKFATNTYEMTANGIEPFVIDPTIGIIIGWSVANEFYSPWPNVGQMRTGAGKNDFANGKGDDMLDAPASWNDDRANLQMVNVVDSTLISLGFTRAVTVISQTAGWPYIGDKIPDSRPGKLFFARLILEATVDNNFGAQQTLRFRKGDNITFQSVPLVLEKQLSARAAIYRVLSLMPDWTSNNPAAGEYLHWIMGAATPAGDPQVRIAAAQVGFGQNAQWLELNDFPLKPADAVRIDRLEAQAVSNDPTPAMLIGEDFWLINDRLQNLHVDNLFEARTERKGVLTTLMSPSPSLLSSVAVPLEQSLEAGSFVLDPAKLGDTAYIRVHRYSDTAGGFGSGRSYRSAPITVHKAAASGRQGAAVAGSNTGNGTITLLTVDPAATLGAYTVTVNAGAETFSITGPSSYASRGVIGAPFDGAVNFFLRSGSVPFIAGDSFTITVTTKTIYALGIGDSIMSQTLVGYVKDRLLARGTDMNLTGTIGPNGNEGRPGSTITDHIYQRTTYLAPVTNWPAYLALPSSGVGTTKLTFNPFIRASIGGDPPTYIYNSRIFDFAYYLLNSGVIPPTHVWICLGTNDIATYAAADAADWIEKGLTIMVNQILAALPTVQIAICLPTLPRTALADARWNLAYGLALRKILKFKRTLANARVKVVSIWTNINQVTGFDNAEVVVSTDPDTGMQTLDNGDMLHPYIEGVHQYAEPISGWIANTAEGT